MYYLNTQAGANQTQNLAALLENYDQVLNAHQLALDSAGSATKENAAYMDSFEAKINNLKAALQELALKVINSDLIKAIIDFGTKLTQVAGSDMGAFLIKTISITAAVNGLFKALKGFKTFFEFKTLAEGAAAVASNVATGTTAVGGLTAALSSLAGPLGIILGIVTAIVGAVALYKKYQQLPGERLERDKETLKETRDKYKEITDEYEALLARQKDLVRQGKDLNQAEKKRLELLKEQTKELEQQEKQQLANVATSTVGALEYTKVGTKTVRKGQDSAVIDTKEVIKGQKAFDMMASSIAKATEQYEKGEITLSDYNDRTSELKDQLNTVYDSYLEVIRSGGELNEQDKQNYETLVDLKVAWVNAEGASSGYAKALKKISPNTEEAIYVTDLFGDSLKLVGDKYQFVSEGAKKAAQDQLKTEIELTKQTLKQISARMSARLSEFGTMEEFSQGVLSKASPTAAGNFMSSSSGKLVSRYYKLQKTLDKINKIGVSNSLGGIGGSGSKGKSGSKSDSDKDKDELNKYKKRLEKYQKAQEDLYKRGEISASEYYSRVEKKGRSYYQKLKEMGDDYRKTNSTVVNSIFDELEYRYKEGIIDGQKYYSEIWKYAKKFYKNGKIDFDTYRKYIKNGYEGMFDGIKKQYESGQITAEQYMSKVNKAQASANSSIRKAVKSGSISGSTVRETRNALVKAAASAKNEAAKALKEAAIKAAEAAVDAAEKRLAKANVFINALQFYADEQMSAIDKVIDGYNDEIDKLNEKMDLLDKQNDALDKQAERIKLVNALEDAKKEKTVRVYDESLGWIWTADPRKVKDAQTALEDFDTERKREQEKQAIQNQIDAFEALIKKKEQEKQAYQDVIDTQSKALERYNIEAELGMKIEQAIFQNRTQNFTNWKSAYIDGTNEVIAATKALASAQAALDAANAMVVPEILYGETQTLGADYTYTSDMTAQERRNAAVTANVEQRQNEGYKVNTWKDDKGNLHYKATSTPTSKTNVKAGTATSLKNTTTSKSKTKKTTSKKKKKASGSISLPSTGIYNVNELGDELMIPPTGNYDFLKKGTGIIPANLTRNLMDWGKFNPKNFIGGQPNVISNDHSITIQNMTVQTNDAQDFVRQLQNLAILKK